MTLLVPMSEKTYSEYLQYIIKAYAEDSVAAGRWPAKGALERSRQYMQVTAARTLYSR